MAGELDGEGRLNLVSFGDDSCRDAKLRLLNQAIDCRSFKRIWVWGEEDLDPAFRQRHSGILSSNIRGFGYWIWKPQVVLQALGELDQGDVLLYLDAGCHLNPVHRDGLGRYSSRVAASRFGVLCSETPFKESNWAKGDLIDFMGVRESRLILNTGQRQGGVVFYQKRPNVVAFVEEWLAICEQNLRLIDDSPSISTNEPGFIENRHDQAVFSILSKQYGASTFHWSELHRWESSLVSRPPFWYPIEARRDRYPRRQIRITSRILGGMRDLLRSEVCADFRAQNTN